MRINRSRVCVTDFLESLTKLPQARPWIPVSTGMTVLFVSYLRKQVSRPTGQDEVSLGALSQGQPDTCEQADETPPNDKLLHFPGPV